MIFPRRLTPLLLLGLAHAGLAAAASPAETPPPPPSLADRAAPSARYPSYPSYLQALQLLAGGNAPAARALLEDLVIAQPDFAGAWLDLALACAQSGDLPAALEHLAYIRSRFPLSAALQRQLELWQGRWQQALQTPTQDAAPGSSSPDAWHGQLGLTLGAGNNVNGGIQSAGLNLSLQDGSQLWLPLAATARPQAAAWGQLELSAWRRLLLAPLSEASTAPQPDAGLGAALAAHLPAGRLYPLLRLRSRQLPGASQWNQASLQAGLLWQGLPDAAGRQWQASAWLQHERYGQATRQTSQRLSLQRHLPWQGQGQGQDCRLYGGLELEARHTPGLPLGALIGWLELGLGCRLAPLALLGPASALAPPGQLHLRLRSGLDTASSPQRPGGDSRPSELLLAWQQPLSPSQLFELRWQHAQSHDSQGYSPLLAQGAARRLRRQACALGFIQRLTPAWEVRLDLDWQRQSSNLEIFRQQSRQASLGLSWQW